MAREVLAAQRTLPGTGEPPGVALATKRVAAPSHGVNRVGFVHADGTRLLLVGPVSVSVSTGKWREVDGVWDVVHRDLRQRRAYEGVELRQGGAAAHAHVLKVVVVLARFVPFIAADVIPRRSFTRRRQRLEGDAFAVVHDVVRRMATHRHFLQVHVHPPYQRGDPGPNFQRPEEGSLRHAGAVRQGGLVPPPGPRGIGRDGRVGERAVGVADVPQRLFQRELRPRRHLKSCQTGADGIALALEVGVDALYDGAAHVKGEYDGARAHHGGLTAPVVGLPRAPPRFVL